MKKAYDFRPLEFNTLLSRSFALYISNFVTLAVIYTIFFLLPLLLVHWLAVQVLNPLEAGGRIAGMRRSTLVFWVVFLLGWLLLPVGAQGAACFTISRAYHGAKTTVADSIRAVLRNWLALSLLGLIQMGLFGVTTLCSLLLLTSLLDGTASMLAVLAVIVLVVSIPTGLCILTARLGPIAAVIMMENATLSQAFKRTWWLTKGEGSKCFGLCTLLFMTVMLAWAPAAMGMGMVSEQLDRGYTAYFIASLIGEAWFALLLPLFGLAQVPLYYDLRSRREGFDLAVLASQFGVDFKSLDIEELAARGYVPAGMAPNEIQPVVYIRQQPEHAPQGAMPNVWHGAPATVANNEPWNRPQPMRQGSGAPPRAVWAGYQQPKQGKSW